MPFQLNNRLDIKDGKMWREGLVINIDNKKLKIRYKGISPKYDEWIDSDREAFRIKEVGAFSG